MLDRPEKTRKRLGAKIGQGVDPIIVWLGCFIEGERITTETLASKAGCSGGCIRAWINGRRNPNFGDLKACLNVLGYELVLKRKPKQNGREA